MSTYVSDSGTISTVASLIAGFSTTMLYFRIQRELTMQEAGEPNWIPWADRLLVIAAAVAMLLGVVPLLTFSVSSRVYVILPPASCACASVFAAGYPLAILAHYRFILGKKRRGPRENPEPAEKWIVAVTFVAAVAIFIWTAWS